MTTSMLSIVVWRKKRRRRFLKIKSTEESKVNFPFLSYHLLSIKCVCFFLLCLIEDLTAPYCWERTGCSLRDGAGATDFLCPEDDMRLMRAGVRW